MNYTTPWPYLMEYLLFLEQPFKCLGKCGNTMIIHVPTL